MFRSLFSASENKGYIYATQQIPVSFVNCLLLCISNTPAVRISGYILLFQTNWVNMQWNVLISQLINYCFCL